MSTQPKREARVVSFAADGRRFRSFSVEAALRLIWMDKAIGTLNKRGRLVCIHFLSHGANPLRATCHAGQRYSREVSKTWEFVPFLSAADQYQLYRECEESEEIELFLRGVFRAVPLSCMKRPPEPPPASAKIIPFPKPITIAPTRKAA